MVAGIGVGLPNCHKAWRQNGSSLASRLDAIPLVVVGPDSYL